MLVPLARVTTTLLLLTQPRRSTVRLSGASGGDDDDLLARATDVGSEVLGDASNKGNAALEALEARLNARLESMGAQREVPKQEQTAARGSGFAISNAAGTSEEAAERLYRMRMKDNGLLEADNADAIARAQKLCQQWLDAGLTERALTELTSVEKLVSYKTEVGALFHLLYAKVCDSCGRTAQAKRILQRVMNEAGSSSHRWQAEQALERSVGGGAKGATTEKSEYTGLFRMPDSW